MHRIGRAEKGEGRRSSITNQLLVLVRYRRSWLVVLFFLSFVTCIVSHDMGIYFFFRMPTQVPRPPAQT